jgi:hypothetical protein
MNRRTPEDIAARRALRDAARAAGLERYDPMEPCSNGHTAHRYVGIDECVECKAACNVRAKAVRTAGSTAAPKPTATATVEIQSAVVRAPEARTLSDGMSAAIFKELGHNPFAEDLEFAEDADGFAMARPTSAPLDTADDDQSPKPYVHSDEWHRAHGYVEIEYGVWVDHLALHVQLAQAEAIEAEHRWRAEQGLPKHIAEARVPMKAWRLKKDRPGLPIEGGASPAG